MQNNFYPKEFFDLENVFFKDLFEKDKPAWDALKNLSLYLDEFIKKHKKRLIFLGENSVIEPSVHIKGRCVIGKNCRIGHGAFIREDTIIGDNCTIGHACEIKHSIFLPGSTAAHFNYIGDSIVGKNVNIASSTVFANFRLDKKMVTIKLNNDKIETGLQKFGAVIGDNSNIGASCVFNPGTVVAKSCIVYPQMQLSGFYKEGSKIK